MVKMANWRNVWKNVWGRVRRGHRAWGRAATGRGRLAARWGGRRQTAVLAIGIVVWKFLPFVLAWDCCGSTDGVGNGWRGNSMVRGVHNTAAGAGLRVTGIFSRSSIPINMESRLMTKYNSHTFSISGQTWMCHILNSWLSWVQYLGHMWWQLWTNEANVVIVDGRVDSWDHCGSWGWLTRESWKGVVVSFLLLIGGPVAKENNVLVEYGCVMMSTEPFPNTVSIMFVFLKYQKPCSLTLCRKGRTPAGWEQS